MNVAKIHFWQLTFFFLLLSVLALISGWSNVQTVDPGMMGQMMGMSMGEMMRMMHASNITLLDVLQWKTEAMPGMNMAEQDWYLIWVNSFTSNVVFLIAPLILAGTVFLLIAWYC